MVKIIPTPKRIEEKEGRLDLRGVSLCIKTNKDSRVNKIGARLCAEITEKTGSLVPITVGDKEKSIVVSYNETNDENYTLIVNESGVEIVGGGAAGAYYGIQTLRQLVKEQGAEIPFLEIEDEPDFSYRGFYQDITRGRVNKLEKLYSIVDTLAYYKNNSLQLYVEDAFLFKEFEGIITADEAMTSEEMIALDDYCYENFVELVPSLSTFGHLFTLLQSDRFSYINELEGHKMTMHYWMEKQWHHTVNVYHPDTIKVIGSMIEQYIALFRSDKFNICCDETNDLCGGKNAGKDKGEAYFYHLQKLIGILKKHGKTVMMWGDVIMGHEDLVKQYLPEDVIVLNWNYHKSVPQWLGAFFHDRGYKNVACPGTSSWNNFVEDIDISEGNISEFSAYAKEYESLGMLNTNWGDFGHICSFNCNLYGMLLGCEKSWRAGGYPDDEFRAEASKQLYSVDFDMTKTIRALAKAQETSEWGRIVRWYSDLTIDKNSHPIPYGDGKTEEDAKAAVETCKTEIARLKALNRDDAVIGDMILAAKGIELMNRHVLAVNGVAGYTDRAALKADFDKWLPEYEKAWLRDDKPSQLWRIREYIEGITTVEI